MPYLRNKAKHGSGDRVIWLVYMIQTDIQIHVSRNLYKNNNTPVMAGRVGRSR